MLIASQWMLYALRTILAASLEMLDGFAIFDAGNFGAILKWFLFAAYG